MKNKTFTILIICLLALALVSCQNAKGDKNQAKLRKVRVILDWTPNTNHAGLFVARDLGYFKEAGLDVEIIQPGENTSESLVAAGKAEFGVSYQESVTIARSKSIPIRSVAAIIQHNTSGFASLKNSGITSPKDFEGKRYGSSEWPSELDILREVMAAVDADYRKVKVISGVYDFQSTIGKDADFEWIFFGWDGVKAQLSGIEINYQPIREINPIFDFYTPVLIANAQTLETDPQLARDFLKAVSRGYNFCTEKPDEAAKVLSKAVPELDSQLVAASLRYLKNEFRADAPKWGQQKAETWQRFADWIYDKRIIQIGVKASDLFTNEFLP